MPFRPLTIVAVTPEDIAFSGVSKKPLAARANARIPGLMYWSSVAALLACAVFCIWAIATGRLIRVIYTPTQTLTAIVRMLATLALLAGLPLTLALITRINRRYVFAARRELGDPICGRCGYPLQQQKPSVCPECGMTNT
ncbi:MAG: hypothetical protein QM783_05800 [Phycisphaerales bacterium]